MAVPVVYTRQRKEVDQKPPGPRVSSFVEQTTHLGTGTGGGGHSDQRPQGFIDRLALANRGVDKVVQVRVRVAREQVGDFLQSAARRIRVFTKSSI